MSIVQTLQFKLCPAQDGKFMKKAAHQCRNNGVFPKWSRHFIELSGFNECDKSLKHKLDSICINFTQLKNPISHLCPVGAMVACWCLTQKVAGSSPCIDVTECSEFSETFRKKFITKLSSYDYFVQTMPT